jgi:hypothetical protein
MPQAKLTHKVKAMTTGSVMSILTGLMTDVLICVARESPLSSL